MPTKPDPDDEPQQQLDLRENFERYADFIPEGATPVYGWRILSYINDEGKQLFGWTTDGDPSFSDTCGYFELVKFNMLHELSLLGHAGDDDDD